MESSKQIPRSPAMKTLLQINTSMFSAGGQSSRLAQQFVDEWRQGNPVARVIVRAFLRFLRMDDVEFVYAEGLAMGDAAKEQALAKATGAIRALAQPVAIAA